MLWERIISKGLTKALVPWFKRNTKVTLFNDDSNTFNEYFFVILKIKIIEQSLCSSLSLSFRSCECRVASIELLDINDFRDENH